MIADFRLEVKFLAGDRFQSRRTENKWAAAIFRFKVTSFGDLHQGVVAEVGQAEEGTGCDFESSAHGAIVIVHAQKEFAFLGTLRMPFAVCVRIKRFVPLHNAP